MSLLEAGGRGPSHVSSKVMHAQPMDEFSLGFDRVLPFYEHVFLMT